MRFLNDLTMELIVTRIGAFLLYTALQGALLVALATLLGNRRPQREGRLTLNPFNHLAVWGLAMAALFQMGWIRAVRLDTEPGATGRLKLVAIALLTLAGMVLTVPLLDLLRPLIQTALPRTGGYAVLGVIEQFQQITLASSVLNILPLPGLVGAALLQAVWPAGELRLRRWEPFVLAGIVAFLVLGWVPSPLPYLTFLH